MMGVFVQVNEGSRNPRSMHFPIGYVIQENGCWDWVGAINGAGYGNWWNGRSKTPAHRVMYERHRGPIPKGLHLDHLCRNKVCVNPDHLEAVTRKENILRGVSPSAICARKTHCHRGHPLSGENLTMKRYKNENSRACRECDRTNARNKYWARKQRNP